MPDLSDVSREENLADIVEALRASRFPELDRGLVLQMLQLHGGGERLDNLGRKIDEAIVAAIGEPE